MTGSAVRVTVVGAGVVGLSCALGLAEGGAQVDVVARERTADTTSAVAAAIWYPYHAFPLDRVTAWGRVTFDRLCAIATDPDSGVRLVDGVELLDRPMPPPAWAAAVSAFGPAADEDVPAGYCAGWSFTTPVVEMPTYLPWLAACAQRAGVRMVRADLAEWPCDTDLVVNAAGLGGGALAGDRSTFPVRGQVVYVEQFGLDRWWLDEAGPTYLVPRRSDVVVGGTDVEGDWSTVPDPAQTRAILRRAAAIIPAVAHARVLGTRVGLRPGRSEVRLEREERSDGPPVVHCYGHGGAGVTLSWGCAADVVRLSLGGTAR